MCSAALAQCINDMTEDNIPAALVTWSQFKKEYTIPEAELEKRIKEGKLPRPFIYDGKRCFMRVEVEAALKNNGHAVRRAVVRYVDDTTNTSQTDKK